MYSLETDKDSDGLHIWLNTAFQVKNGPSEDLMKMKMTADSFALIPNSGKPQVLCWAIQESGIPFDNFHHWKQIAPGLGFEPLTC